MSERRFLLILSIPLATVLVLFIAWQQGFFDPCETCGGEAWVRPPYVPEYPPTHLVRCSQCDWGARVSRMARAVDGTLPEGPERVYYSISVLFLAALVWGLRTVRCRGCAGGGVVCGKCGGRGRTTRLDGWVNSLE